MKIQSHRELTVWQKGVELACGIYGLTRQMPKEEVYRLSGQIIRCSTSIPANIAEGNARGPATTLISSASPEAPQRNSRPF